MTPLQGLLIIKLLLDAAASIGWWCAMHDHRQALMFFGFAVADFACLLMAPGS